MKKHHLLAMFAGILAMVVMASAPARALDDDGHESLFKTFTGLITTNIGIPGLTPREHKPTINYRERAPLVVPKKRTLRAPLPPVAKRNRAWPKDFDRESAKRKRGGAVDHTVERDDAGNVNLSARYLRDTGRLRRNPARNLREEECDLRGDPLRTPCNVPKMWSTLKNNKLNGGTKDLVPGVEPPRTALTDPPRGLRSPSRRTKYTFEAPEDTPIVPNPQEAIRSEAKREEAYR